MRERNVFVETSPRSVNAGKKAMEKACFAGHGWKDR
jgi:hypothetical protein